MRRRARSGQCPSLRTLRPGRAPRSSGRRLHASKSRARAVARDSPRSGCFLRLQDLQALARAVELGVLFERLGELCLGLRVLLGVQVDPAECVAIGGVLARVLLQVDRLLEVWLRLLVLLLDVEHPAQLAPAGSVDGIELQ